jgi:N-acetylglutamate synthase-like GNAT family acetyltransferase
VLLKQYRVFLSSRNSSIFHPAPYILVEMKKRGGKMEEHIREAEVKDIKRLESFLAQANVSCDGVADHIEFYSLLETRNGNLKACIGIEPAGSAGLLRSFVLSPGTSQGDVLLLFDRVVAMAEKKQLNALYLATNKEQAASFFQNMGFQKTEDLPVSLYKNSHMKQALDVDNCIVMKMPL